MVYAAVRTPETEGEGRTGWDKGVGLKSRDTYASRALVCFSFFFWTIQIFTDAYIRTSTTTSVAPPRSLFRSSSFFFSDATRIGCQGLTGVGKLN